MIQIEGLLGNGRKNKRAKVGRKSIYQNCKMSRNKERTSSSMMEGFFLCSFHVTAITVSFCSILVVVVSARTDGGGSGRSDGGGSGGSGLVATCSGGAFSDVRGDNDAGIALQR